MLMNTFEELTQAMDGCVQRVKWGRTPDVGADYVQYENVVGDTLEWVSVTRRQPYRVLSSWHIVCWMTVRN